MGSRHRGRKWITAALLAASAGLTAGVAVAQEARANHEDIADLRIAVLLSGFALIAWVMLTPVLRHLDEVERRQDQQDEAWNLDREAKDAARGARPLRPAG